MAKSRKPNRTTRKLCVWPNCSRLAVRAADHCEDHVHTLALQHEIRRLKATQASDLARLVHAYPVLRELCELISVLADRAQPLKAAAIQVTPRASSHNLGDGIVLLGDHIVRPGYSVASKPDEGRLGAALARVRDCVDAVKKVADPDPDHKHRDDRIRCGRSTCPHPWNRQDSDSRFCRWCGRSFTEEAESA